MCYNDAMIRKEERLVTTMYSHAYNEKSGLIEITRNGSFWFSVPAAVSVNGCAYAPSVAENTQDRLVLADETGSICFQFRADSIEVSFNRRFDADTPIYEAKYFRNDRSGMNLDGFDRAFCPQPRRNDGHNMDFYKNLPDCSLTGYFSPSILNFSIGSGLGWVSFGLLDIPDSSYYRLCEDFSILAESCGGNKVIRAGETYRMPRLLITFPEDEWQAITLFREKLMAYGLYTPAKPALSEVPAWWREPIICTYGDELSTHMLDDVDMIDPRFNVDWVRMLVDTAEKKWGIRHMNIVLDAFWQIQFALDPRADESRFGDMRAFTDEMHARGHHVLAWITPMFDSIANGFETRSQRLGVLSNRELAPLGVEGSRSIELTSDNAALYYREVARQLFGDGEGEYHFDGVKMDYMALQRNPALHGPYAHPEKGLGMRELKLFYEMFRDAAKSVREEVLINCSVTDPRFEHLIDLNRLHDTHAGCIEKEMRARVSTLACPELLIDSDGALMLTDWAKRHYICAAIYSIPSNYYTLRYHDRPMDERDLPGMGTLLQMAKLRPDGRALMESFGNWRLEGESGDVRGRSLDGHTLVFYPWEKSEKGYLFTWQNETVIIPLQGRKFGKLEPAAEGYQVDYARDQVIIRLKPGVLYSFESIDEGNGIDNLFRTKAPDAAVEMDYSN